MPTDHDMHTSPPSSPSAFDTAYGDIAELRLRAERDTTPFITASGAMRFALLPKSPPKMPRLTPSPLPGFADLANLDSEAERTTWFVDMASMKPLSPVTDPMSAASLSPPPLAGDDIPEAPKPQQYWILARGPGTPFLFYRLVDVNAKFWALLTLDISNCLWARMSHQLVGREPCKSLFLSVYKDAIDRRNALAGGNSERSKCRPICHLRNRLNRL